MVGSSRDVLTACGERLRKIRQFRENVTDEGRDFKCKTIERENGIRCKWFLWRVV